MPGSAVIDINRVQDAASCRQWLAGIDASDGRRLATLDRLFAGLQKSRHAPDVVFEILEQARVAHLADVEDRLRSLAASAFPMPVASWQRLHGVLASMRSARSLYERVYVQLVEDSGASTRSVIPGAADSLRTVLPLARALDYQARVLLALMQHRAEVPAEDWRELCLLAQHLRRSTFLDATLPDESALIRPSTARALFVYPLLLALAHPEARSEPAFALVDRLARRWAGKVGFRVDEDGKLHENKHGPTLVLGETLSVRLDTHRLLPSLDAKREALNSREPGAELRLPRGMSAEQTRRLLDELRLSWSDAWRPPRTQRAPCEVVRMRFGVPSARSASQDATEPAPVAGGVASQAYVYGRFEHNTIIRLALGAGSAPRDPIVELMASGEQALWRSAGSQNAVFERRSMAAPVALDMLVAVAPGGEPQSEPLPALLVGRVISLQQWGSAEPVALRTQRLGVVLYGPAQLVGVRMAEDAFYEDAFFLPGSTRSGEPPSIIVASGRWRMGASAMMREPRRDIRIQFESLLDRGVGFERVKVKLIGP